MTHIVPHVKYKSYVGDLKFHPKLPGPVITNMTGFPENISILVDMEWLKWNFRPEYDRYMIYKRGN